LSLWRRVGTTTIALGFYDHDDLLRELNRELRGFAYNFEDRVDLVRHEMGHAFSYAYKLYRRDDSARCSTSRATTSRPTPKPTTTSST